MNASEQQLHAIEVIQSKKGLSFLPPALRQIAKLRMENTEVSLEELGQMLDPPIGKSGVNHRMRRLIALAQTLEAPVTGEP